MKQKPHNSKLHNPRGLLAPLLIGAIMLGGYFAYYEFLSSKIIAALEGQKGKKLEYSRIEKSGFPYRLSLRIYDLKAANLTTDTIRLTASPFDPYNWVIDEVKLPKINDNGTIFLLSPSALKSSFSIDKKSNQLSHFAISFDEMAIGDNTNNIVQLGKTNAQYVREFQPKPQEAANIEIANLGTNNSILGIELDFTDIVLRGPILNENGIRVFDIKYGKAKITPGNIEEITGRIELAQNTKINGDIAFCFTLSKELSPNNKRMCGLKLEINNSKLHPNFGALINEF